MATIREIEDGIVNALVATGDFELVVSIPKGQKPFKTIVHPAAFVYFERDILSQEKTRPIYKNYFAVIVEHFLAQEGGLSLGSHLKGY